MCQLFSSLFGPYESDGTMFLSCGSSHISIQSLGEVDDSESRQISFNHTIRLRWGSRGEASGTGSPRSKCMTTVVVETSDREDEDFEKAMQASLQENFSTNRGTTTLAADTSDREDEDFEKAMRASLQENFSPKTTETIDREEEDLEKAIQASLQDISQPRTKLTEETITGEDNEVEQAIQASLQESWNMMAQTVEIAEKEEREFNRAVEASIRETFFPRR